MGEISPITFEFSRLVLKPEKISPFFPVRLQSALLRHERAGHRGQDE